MRRRIALIALGAAVLPAAPGQPAASKRGGPTPISTYRELQALEHDSDDYTQGLIYQDGVFYEGTGQYGHSRIRKYRYANGKRQVLQSVDIPSQYFGEGIALLKGKLVQLTWQSERGFIYQANDLKKIAEFSYQGEGWGLTTDGRDFLMSDGTPTIRVLDGERLLGSGQCVVKRTIQVTDQGRPVAMLNELEMIQGELYANVWQTDRIAVISPKSGEVLRWIDLSNLISPMQRRQADAVLNGIAFDAEGKRLFVTGKLWPQLFQIREIAPKK